jgi:hypothetical protein
LNGLGCSYNQLIIPDLTKQPGFTTLRSGGNMLTSLNISNNTSFGLGAGSWINCFLEIGDMPGLEKVCAREMSYDSKDPLYKFGYGLSH